MNKITNFLCLSLLLLGATALGMDDFNQRNQRLIEQARRGSLDLISTLIERGASANARNDAGETPLMRAAEYGREDVCKLLIMKGAFVNARNDVGETPLMCAAMNGHTAVCRLLIANKASAKAENNCGQTPLIYASGAFRHREEVCRLLIDAMIRPTKEQVDSIVALLGISKKRQSEQLNLAGRDVVKMIIGPERYNELRLLNKSITRDAILNIRNANLRHELLHYLDSI